MSKLAKKQDVIWKYIQKKNKLAFVSSNGRQLCISVSKDPSRNRIFKNRNIHLN
jgi:hypothetical protein